VARRRIHKSRVSNAKASEAPRAKNIHVSNDSTGTQVEEGAKEHIQASKPSNIVTTSYHRVPTMVRSAVKFSRADHPRKVPRPGHSPMVLKAK
jgi:hypothetical protein